MTSYFSSKKILFLGVLVVASACSRGAGTKEELQVLLEAPEDISAAQAECLADKIFDEYGNDEERLKRISDFDFASITGEDVDRQVDGFDEFYKNAEAECQ